jgi:beta-lactamase superfamily II metal-dependent hydrolase
MTDDGGSASSSGKKVKLAGGRDSDGANTLDDRSTHLLLLHLDVGQGESMLLLELANNRPIAAAVFDGGHGTPGRGALFRYALAFGLRRIDFLVCSHYDGDHGRGLIEFMRHHGKGPGFGGDGIEIGRLYVRSGAGQGSVRDGLLAAAGAIEVPVSEAGADPFNIEDWPGRATFRCFPGEVGELMDENRGSLAWLISFGPHTYFTAGDMPSDLEYGVATRIAGRVDCLKCGHHGSRNSSSEAFLNILDPAVAVLSCGRHSYGHPSYDVIENLARTGRSLQAIYATNCFHNRRCFGNPTASQENLIVREILGYEFCSETREIREEAGVDYGEIFRVDDYSRAVEVNDDRLAAEIEELSELSREADSEDERRRFGRCVRAFKSIARARAHLALEDLKDGEDFASPRNIGRVAGEPNALGSVAIVFAMPDDGGYGPRTFFAGLYDTLPAPAIGGGVDERLTFRWYVVGREQVPLSVTSRELQIAMNLYGLGSLIEQAITADDFREVRPAPGSPGGFAPHFVERRERYAQFRLPTMTGMSDTARQTPYVPFCAACAWDIDDDGDAFELIEIHENTVEMGDPDFAAVYSFHRGCFSSWLDAMSTRDVVLRVLPEDAAEFRNLSGGDIAQEPILRVDCIDVDSFLTTREKFDWVALTRVMIREALGDLEGEPADLLRAAWERLRDVAARLDTLPESSDDDYVD